MLIKSINEAKIIAKVLGKTDQWQQIILEKTVNLSKIQEIRISKLIQKFNNGFPMDYILGQLQFLDNTFRLLEGVLVPRPETEIWVFNLIKKIEKNPLFYSQKTLIDVGCGSGVIGLSFAKYFKHVIFVDLYKKPLRNVQLNVEKLGLSNKTTVIKSNLLNEFVGRRVLESEDFPIFLNFASSEVVEVKSSYFEILKNLKIQRKNTTNPITQSCLNPVPALNDLSHLDYVLIANLPYVPTIDVKNKKQNRISYEPHNAIFSGVTGLDHTIRLLKQLNLIKKPIEMYLELDARSQNLLIK